MKNIGYIPMMKDFFCEPIQHQIKIEDLEIQTENIAKVDIEVQTDPLEMDTLRVSLKTPSPTNFAQRITTIDIPEVESRMIDQSLNTSRTDDDGMYFKVGEASPNHRTSKDDSDSMINDNNTFDVDTFFEKAKALNASRFYQKAKKGGLSGNGSIVGLDLNIQSPRDVESGELIEEKKDNNEEDDSKYILLTTQIEALVASYKQILHERDQLKDMIRRNKPTKSLIGSPSFRRAMQLPKSILIQ